MEKAALNIMHKHSRKEQRGAVLIVSLLVLLVLTLIGISALNGSIMEEKMASNSQTSSTVFQAAESAIRETFYAENVDPAMAVDHAQSGNTADCTNCGITSSTRMVYPDPDTNGRPPLYNSSSDKFVARGIEIVGTASMRGISDQHTQGYSVSPMRR
jgi:type IV pilus assembly protein PilX